jgi:hypothetical protein
VFVLLLSICLGWEASSATHTSPAGRALLSITIQHHALSCRKGSSFEHEASAIRPCGTSYPDPACCFSFLLFSCAGNLQTLIIVRRKEILLSSFVHRPIYACAMQATLVRQGEKKVVDVIRFLPFALITNTYQY